MLKPDELLPQIESIKKQVEDAIDTIESGRIDWDAESDALLILHKAYDHLGVLRDEIWTETD